MGKKKRKRTLLSGLQLASSTQSCTHVNWSHSLHFFLRLKYGISLNDNASQTCPRSSDPELLVSPPFWARYTYMSNKTTNIWPKQFTPVACFFSRKEYRIAPGPCTRSLHTAQGTRRARTWMLIYPQPVHAQGTQSSGKPCRFQRDTHDQKNTNISQMLPVPGSRVKYFWEM